MRAQKGDITIFGDPTEIFGPGKAPGTNLGKLGKAGLEPNEKKVQVSGTTDDACADKPEWLDETFLVIDPVARARVEAAEAEAAAAAAAATAASPEKAVAAGAAVAKAKEAGEETRRASLEVHARMVYGSAALLSGPRGTSRRNSTRRKSG